MYRCFSQRMFVRHASFSTYKYMLDTRPHKKDSFEFLITAVPSSISVSVSKILFLLSFYVCLSCVVNKFSSFKIAAIPSSVSVSVSKILFFFLHFLCRSTACRAASKSHLHEMKPSALSYSRTSPSPFPYPFPRLATGTARRELD